MLDLGEKWRIEPDWAHARLAGSGVEITAVAGLTQRLVSGDIGRALARCGLGGDVGALGLAHGDRYAVRLARDRLLVIGLSPAEIADGWHEGGYAVTTVDSGQRVFEARGPGMWDLLARAATIDPSAPGPSASILFAGVMAAVYRHAGDEILRIHVDRGLAGYLWEWFECQSLFMRPSENGSEQIRHDAGL